VTPVVVNLSAAELERERPNLERGSVVAQGVAGLAVGAFCDVELVFPSGERATFPARAVLATGAGTVFAFERFDRALLARQLSPPPTPPPPAAAGGAPGEAPGASEGPAAPADPEGGAATVQERLRGLSVAEQLRVAREGTLDERVVLERLYGKTVWEVLLRNPRLTVPEVARMAKLGTLPRTLLEVIVANASWLQNGQVRRALLSNPRLSQEMVQKVLSLLPRDELKLVPQASAYPPTVRAAAKAMVKR
jgi:hypothetical protein